MPYIYGNQTFSKTTDPLLSLADQEKPKFKFSERRILRLVNQVLKGGVERYGSLTEIQELLRRSKISSGVKNGIVERGILGDDDDLLAIIYYYGGGIEEPLDCIIEEAKEKNYNRSLEFLREVGVIPKESYEEESSNCMSQDELFEFLLNAKSREFQYV